MIISEEELLKRKIVLKRLLDIFSGMDGGIDFITLRTFVEECPGDAITRVMTNMGSLLDIAQVALGYTEKDIPERL